MCIISVSTTSEWMTCKQNFCTWEALVSNFNTNMKTHRWWKTESGEWVNPSKKTQRRDSFVENIARVQNLRNKYLTALSTSLPTSKLLKCGETIAAKCPGLCLHKDIWQSELDVHVGNYLSKIILHLIIFIFYGWQFTKMCFYKETGCFFSYAELKEHPAGTGILTPIWEASSTFQYCWHKKKNHVKHFVWSMHFLETRNVTVEINYVLVLFDLNLDSQAHFCPFQVVWFISTTNWLKRQTTGVSHDSKMFQTVFERDKCRICPRFIQIYIIFTL